MSSNLTFFHPTKDFHCVIGPHPIASKEDTLIQVSTDTKLKTYFSFNRHYSEFQHPWQASGYPV